MKSFIPVILTLSLVGCGLDNTMEVESEPNPMVYWNPGEGFDKVMTSQDKVVAWKFIDKGDGILVKPMTGCKSLFVRASAFDSQGVIVDQDVEAVNNVGAEQVARVEFDFNKGKTWNITEIDCFSI